MPVSQALPKDHPLMKAWDAYQETDGFKNSLYWATTATIMTKERAQELGVPPEQNQASGVQREQYAKGSMWAAFVAGSSFTVEVERERCRAIVSAARHGEVDHDLRAIISMIEDGSPIELLKRAAE